MRHIIFMSVIAMLAGCSLFRDAPDTSFLENRPAALAGPGENFVALSGSTCAVSCPQYQIFVFESGRVVFNGQRFTAHTGTVERLTMPTSYYELRKLLTVRRVYSRGFHWGCRADRGGFDIGLVENDRTRIGHLDYGCFNQVDDLDVITKAFIRIADASSLIQ